MTATHDLLSRFDAAAPLTSAHTIPGAWYTDPGIAAAERATVFARQWICVGRAEQARDVGAFFTAEIAGEPIIIIRGRDGVLRAFFNVCRHHAAIVMPVETGCASVLRCPYHGWTYSPEGELKGVPEFDGVCDFDKSANGLVELDLDMWERLIFVRMQRGNDSLAAHLCGMSAHVGALKIGDLQFAERRVYDLACDWKVYVDNFLDGGYHVPHIHKGLGSVLDYSAYAIDVFDRWCLQSSPITGGGEADTAGVRRGAMAYYYWLYPNFMLNWYEGVMDTNVVLPLGPGRCRVIFDFYFGTGATAEETRRRSVAVSERIQQEDIDICESVQRGLSSRAYHAGRLSARREGGERLFHVLLAGDLRAMS